MLDVKQFIFTDGDPVAYFGDNTGDEYIIAPNDRGNGFDIFVTSIDDDGEPYDAGSYAASDFATACAIIEAIENGEKV